MTELKNINESLEETKRLLESVPLVTKKEVLNTIEDCDIILSNPTREMINKIYVNYFHRALQGSPFSSSKIVYNKKFMTGYGLNKKLFVTFFPIIKYVQTCERLIILRYPNLGKEEKSIIKKYFKTNLGLKYNSKSLLGSLIHRSFINKVKSFIAKDQNYILDDKDIDNVKDGLICSNIICIAYRKAGIDLVPTVPIYDVWPIDFLKTSKLIKIAKCGMF